MMVNLLPPPGPPAERGLRPTPVVAPFVVATGVAAGTAAGGGVMGLRLVLIVGVGRTGGNSSLRVLLFVGWCVAYGGLMPYPAP